MDHECPSREFIIQDSAFVRGALAWTICVVLAACGGRTQQEDDAIGRAVKQTLYDYGPVNMLHVEVSVNNRVVYLGGEVDEYSHKEEAERVSKEVGGVRDVVNKVQVEP